MLPHPAAPPATRPFGRVPPAAPAAPGCVIPFACSSLGRLAPLRPRGGRCRVRVSPTIMVGLGAVPALRGRRGLRRSLGLGFASPRSAVFIKRPKKDRRAEPHLVRRTPRSPRWGDFRLRRKHDVRTPRLSPRTDPLAARLRLSAATRRTLSPILLDLLGTPRTTAPLRGENKTHARDESSSPVVDRGRLPPPIAVQFRAGGWGKRAENQ